jgi:hypothetical protein
MISDTPFPSRQYPERSFSVDAFVQSESKQEEQQQDSDLSEEELRELYDQEEIERFLRLFSAVCRFSLNSSKSLYSDHVTVC